MKERCPRYIKEGTSPLQRVLREELLNVLIGSYVMLVVLDSLTTYIAIKYLGFVETWQARAIFDYYGLTLGIIINTAFCLCFAWLLWRIRRFKLASCLGLSALAVTELAAVVSNIIQILSS